MKGADLLFSLAEKTARHLEPNPEQTAALVPGDIWLAKHYHGAIRNRVCMAVEVPHVVAFV